MAKLPLVVKIQVGPRCICVPGEHVLIGASGFFVRDVQLLAGTRVMVQFCRGGDEVSLAGNRLCTLRRLGALCGIQRKIRARGGKTRHPASCLEMV